MRWIIDNEEFERILRDAKECAVYDNNQQVIAELERLTFDCVEFHTRHFFEFLCKLMEWSKDSHFRYIVLEPDPFSYYFTHFSKYPLFEISIDDSDEAYINALNEDPGGSPADAVGTNWFRYVILPPSKKWFIHGQQDARSGEGGNLFVPIGWSDKAREIYPFELY
jgi:hypothetical protein